MNIRKTVLPYWSIALAVSLGMALAGALWAGKVYAEPLFQVQDKGIAITLPFALIKKVVGV